MGITLWGLTYRQIRKSVRVKHIWNPSNFIKCVIRRGYICELWCYMCSDCSRAGIPENSPVLLLYYILASRCIEVSFFLLQYWNCCIVDGYSSKKTVLLCLSMILCSKNCFQITVEPVVTLVGNPNGHSMYVGLKGLLRKKYIWGRVYRIHCYTCSC